MQVVILNIINYIEDGLNGNIKTHSIFQIYQSAAVQSAVTDLVLMMSCLSSVSAKPEHDQRLACQTGQDLVPDPHRESGQGDGSQEHILSFCQDFHIWDQDPVFLWECLTCGGLESG